MFLYIFIFKFFFFFFNWFLFIFTFPSAAVTQTFPQNKVQLDFASRVAFVGLTLLGVTVLSKERN